MESQPLPEGVQHQDLECVMLDVGQLPVKEIYGPDMKEKDLYFAPEDQPRLKYAQGLVAEQSAHVTLLYGIHPSETYVDDVMEALDGWAPEDIFIRKVSYFEGNTEGEKYHIIVGEVFPSANLILANKRLTKLPFTNQHAQYKPHVTLAYIKRNANVNRWVRRLNPYYSNRVITPVGLDLGLDS